MRCYPSSGPIQADDQPESLWVRSSLVPGEIMASIEKALQIAARAHEMTKPAGWRPARSDDRSSRLDEQRRRDEFLQDIAELKQASRLDEPVDRSNRRRLA